MVESSDLLVLNVRCFKPFWKIDLEPILLAVLVSKWASKENSILRSRQLAARFTMQYDEWNIYGDDDGDDKFDSNANVAGQMLLNKMK